MNRSPIFSLTVVVCLSLLPSTGGETLTAAPPDFAANYFIDDVSGDITYGISGVYAAAIDCAGAWQPTPDDLHVELDQTPIHQFMYADTSLHIVSYQGILSKDTIRIVERSALGLEEVLGSWTCSEPRYVMRPPDDATQALVNVTWRAGDETRACTFEEPSGGFERARDKLKLHRAYDLKATDFGACLQLSYVGLVAPTGEACPTFPASACLPFSGNLGGKVMQKESTGVWHLLAEGGTCSFLVVGGWCWGEMWTEPHASPIWHAPCFCQGTHNASLPDYSMGTWGSLVLRVT